MTVAEAQTLCLKQGTPFYSYRLPGERESVFGAQLDGEVAPFRQVGEQGKGFILVPFAESEEGRNRIFPGKNMKVRWRRW